MLEGDKTSEWLELKKLLDELLAVDDKQVEEWTELHHKKFMALAYEFVDDLKFSICRQYIGLDDEEDFEEETFYFRVWELTCNGLDKTGGKFTGSKGKLDFWHETSYFHYWPWWRFFNELKHGLLEDWNPVNSAYDILVSKKRCEKLQTPFMDLMRKLKGEE